MAGLACACGCGNPAPETGRRFIHGHNRRTHGGTYPQLSKTKALGTRLVHRLRAAHALGREVPRLAVVHHTDGTRRADAGLVILENQSEHLRLHARQRVQQAGGNPWAERICDRCRTLKPFAAFSTKPKCYLGLSGTCRVCENARRRVVRADVHHSV